MYKKFAAGFDMFECNSESFHTFFNNVALGEFANSYQFLKNIWDNISHAVAHYTVAASNYNAIALLDPVSCISLSEVKALIISGGRSSTMRRQGAGSLRVPQVEYGCHREQRYSEEDQILR